MGRQARSGNFDEINDGELPPMLEARRLIGRRSLEKLLDTSRSKLYDLQREGKLLPPQGRVGRSDRWSVGEVAAWMDNGRPDSLTWEKMDKDLKFITY